MDGLGIDETVRMLDELRAELRAASLMATFHLSNGEHVELTVLAGGLRSIRGEDGAMVAWGDDDGDED